MRTSSAKFASIFMLMLLVLSPFAVNASGQKLFEELLNIRSEKKSNTRIKPTLPTTSKKINSRSTNSSRATSKIDRKVEVDRLLAIGNSASLRGDFLNAEKAYRKVINYGSKEAALGYWGLGHISNMQGCYDDAIGSFENARDLDSQNPEHHFNLGLSYFNKEDYESSILNFEKVLSLVPIAFNTTIKIAEAYEELKDFENAETFFKKAIALQPNSYIANKAFSEFYFNRENYEMAERLIKPFVNSLVAPEKANAYVSLAAIEGRKSNYKESINNLKKAIKADRGASGSYYFKIGVVFLANSSKELPNGIASLEDYTTHLKVYKEIETNLRAAILRNYAEPDAYFFLGMSLSLQMKFVEAEKEINNGISIANRRLKEGPQQKCPKKNECVNCDIAFGKGVLGINLMLSAVMLENTERQADANTNYAKALQAFNDAASYETPINVWIYYMISSQHYMNGEYKKAINYGELTILSQAACKDCLANNFDFYASLGASYFENSQFADAEKMLKKAITINPNVSRIHVSLGKVYEKQNLQENAKKEYEMAIALNSANEFARYKLGLLLTNLGDKNGALEQYKALERLDADYAKWLLEEINKKFPPNK